MRIALWFDKRTGIQGELTAEAYTSILLCAFPPRLTIDRATPLGWHEPAPYADPHGGCDYTVICSTQHRYWHSLNSERRKHPASVGANDLR
jgi:hypothetical protein